MQIMNDSIQFVIQFLNFLNSVLVNGESKNRQVATPLRSGFIVLICNNPENDQFKLMKVCLNVLINKKGGNYEECKPVYLR